MIHHSPQARSTGPRQIKRYLLPFTSNWLLALALFVVGTAPTSALAQDTESQAARLIKQLGSSSFAARQSAAESLWELGPKIVPILDRAIDTDDLEIALRAKTIRTAFELGLGKDTPYPIAKSVLNFSDREPQVQTRVLQNLRYANQEQLLLNLIEQLPSDRQAKAFKDHFQISPAVATRIEQAKSNERANPAELDRLLKHPLIKKYKPDLYLFWQDLNGEISAAVRNQKNIVDELVLRLKRLRSDSESTLTPGDEDADGSEQPTSPRSATNLTSQKSTADLETERLETELQNELRLLFQLFRSTGQQELAIPYTRHLQNDKTRATLKNQLLMELGNWKLVAQNLVPPNRKPNYKSAQINATIPQLVVAQHFAGNKAAVEEWLTKLEKEFQTLELKNNPQRILEAHKMKLAHCYLLTGNWPQANKWLESNLEDKQATALMAMGKHRELLDEFDYTGDSANRLDWSRKIIRRIEALNRQFERTDNDRFSDKSARLWEMANRLVGQLHSLGLSDEAKYHWQIFFNYRAKEKNSTAQLIYLIRNAIEMGYFELASEALLRTLSLKTIGEQGYQLFPNRPETARVYWPKICMQSQNVEEALRLGSQLYHVPLMKPISKSTDTDRKIRRVIDSNSPINVYENYYQLFLDLYAGNLGDASEHLFGETKLTDTGTQFAASIFRSANRHTEVLEIIDAANRISSPLLHSFRAESNNRLGKFESAKIDQLEAILNFTHSYRANRHLELYRTNRCLPLVERWLNIVVHSTPTQKLVSETYRRHLAESRATGDPIRCAIDWKIFAFNYFKTPTRNISQVEIEILKSVSSADIVSSAAQNQWEVVEVKSAAHLSLFGPDIDLLLAVKPLATSELAAKTFGKILAKQKQAYYERLVEFPNSPMINNNYAWMLAKLDGDLEFAATHCQLALDQEPRNESYLDTMAFIRWRQGNQQQAIELQRQCIQQQPTNFVFWKRYFAYGGSFKNPEADASNHFAAPAGN